MQTRATKTVFFSLYSMKFDMETIVLACQRKETWAQKALYEAYAPQMLGVCMRYTRSRDEAQDLLHDGFIKIFESIRKLQQPSALPSWIFKVMVRISVDYVRKNNMVVYQEVDSDSLVGNIENQPFDTDQFAVMDVMEAIRQLPAHSRLLFNMHEVDGLEYSEIADLLQVSETTVRSGVCRAKQQLKTFLLKN